MRRWVAVVAITGALAACRGEKRPAPEAASPPGAPAGAPAPAPGGAQPAPSPRGDRHARAAARRTHVVRRATGTVSRADGRFLVIDPAGAPPLTLRIAPGTTVTLDGRPARPEALPPGAEVRAAYRTGEGDRPTAIAVEARRAGPPPAPRPSAPAAPEAPAAPPEAEPTPEPSGG